MLRVLVDRTLGSDSKAQMRYDVLALTTMASGHLCLNLSEAVSWERFPQFSEALLMQVGGTRLRATDAVDARLWDVTIEGHRLQLAFDDFPSMVSLESRDAAGDDVLRRLYASLECAP